LPILSEDNKAFVIWNEKKSVLWKSDGASRHVANLYLERSGAEKALRHINQWHNNYVIREVDLSFLREEEV